MGSQKTNSAPQRAIAPIGVARGLALIVLATFCLCRLLAAEPVAKKPAAGLIGRRVPNFVLKNSAGETQSLADFSDKRAVVLVFVSTECPIANEFLPIVEQLAKKFADRSVQFLTIYSSPSDTAESIAAHQKQFKLTLPALYDREQQVLQSVGAERTAEAFVLDGRSVIRYHGRIDDRYGYDYHRDTAKRNDLEIALTELLDHKQISVPTTSAQGCAISPRESDSAAGKITYCNQVSRILQEKCQTCHRPGAAAPFSLLEPDTAVHWSEMIKQVVLERRMPPWHADSRYGKFSNDRRLSQDQIDTLVGWVDQGTPLGDKSQLPARREFSEGWTIGKPDVVFELPDEVTVPATGTVPYRYFETPTNLKEDVWIQAAEARPGNRAAVHHIIAFYRDPKEGKQRRQRPMDRRDRAGRYGADSAARRRAPNPGRRDDRLAGSLHADRQSRKRPFAIGPGFLQRQGTAEI